MALYNMPVENCLVGTEGLPFCLVRLYPDERISAARSQLIGGDRIDCAKLNPSHHIGLSACNNPK